MAISDDIKARLDIVDVVQRYVPDLRQAGRNFAARCPFHAERTPSFYVFPERQSWRCFGACATGGDAFSFVMKAENVDFGEALKRLAAIAGVTIPDKRRPEAPRNPLLDANDAAARLFRESLLADRGAVARDYLKQRGVNDESVATFGLGYSPATGDELQHRLRAMGFSQDLLIEAGLLTRGDTGPIRDMFRGRLMFAIRNDRGEIVGFGGRSLDGSNPKYLNTPQTTVFDKGKLLFALDRAREAIRREGRAVVVEGYMDAIAAHQHGFRNVVASMGTALTDSQANALRGSGAAQIVLALDADAAGQEAMLRSLHSVWQLLGQSLEGIRRAGSLEIKGRSGDLDRLRVAVVPEGKDPDDMIRKDPAAWNRLIQEAPSAVDFLLTAETAKMDLSTGQGKAQAADRLLPLIYGMPNWVEQDRYFQKLADLLQVPRATLEAAASRPIAQPPRPGQRKAAPPRDTGAATAAVFRRAAGDPLEDYTLALIFRTPELVERLDALRADYFHRPENRELLSLVKETGSIETTSARLDGHLGEHLQQLATRDIPPADRKTRADDLDICIRRLEERFLRELKAQEEVALAAASQDGDPSHADHLEAVRRQSLATNERLRELFVSGSNASFTRRTPQ